MGYSYLKDQSTVDLDGLLIGNYEDDAVMKGNAYIIETTFNLTASSTVYTIIDPSALSGKRLTVMPTSWEMSDSYARVTLGTCASASGGTAITFLNRNWNYKDSNPAITTCKVRATPDTPVDSPANWLVGSSAKKALGGSSGGGGIQILDPSLVYYFKIQNLDATDAIITVYIKIFESIFSAELGF